MEQQHLQNMRRALSHARTSPLGEYVDELAQQFVDQGYRHQAIQYAVQLVANFGHWMQQQKLTSPELTPEQINRFWQYHTVHRSPRHGDHLTLRRLSSILVEKGVVAPAVKDELTPLQQIASEYQKYLEQERKLAPASVRLYLIWVRHFIAEQVDDGVLKLGNLSAADVVGFVQREAARIHNPSRAKGMTIALRSFLQYAHYKEIIPINLRTSVPTVANWAMASLPRSMSAEDVERLLAHGDRNSAVGCRNLAILLLLARLGLRAGEVVNLMLDDIDWERGELSIRSIKGHQGHCDQLPLPQDVGAALADYLRNFRPSCSSRYVFIRLNAPCQKFANSEAISTLVHRAIVDAGLNPSHKGAHVLRHSVATNLLRQGASLAEIGELLRHRSQDSTTIYAKVDLGMLRPLAQPWPGSTQ